MKNAKKIVLAATLAEFGGVQLFIAEFAHWLKQLGHSVIVIAGQGVWLETYCKKHSIPFIRMHKLTREIHPLKDVSAIMEMYHVLKKIQPDVIQLHSAKMSIVGSIASRLSKIKRVVYCIGGWTFREVLPFYKTWIYTKAEVWTSQWKDSIICVNPEDVDLAKDVGIQPRESIIAIPNGIDLPSFDQQQLHARDARKKIEEICHQDFASDVFLYGTTANFFAPKDLVRYMDTCQLVHKKNPHSRFIIFGDGELRKDIEKKRDSLGLKNIVFLPGQINNAKTLLSGLNAFVLPSSKEGMPFALLEAMAAKLPCITTNAGAMQWMLGDGGITVPIMQTDQLAEAMLNLQLDHKLQKALGDKARSIVEKQFPLEVTFKQHLECLILA